MNTDGLDELSMDIVSSNHHHPAPLTDEPEYVRRRLCKIPNPASYAIVDTAFKEYFGDRYHQLCETEGYKIAQTYTKVSEVPLDMRQYFPQGHPFWLEFRSEAQVTGSVSAALVGFHDLMAAKFLGVPKVMWVKGGTNEKWDDYLDRARFPGMPSTGLDPPGNFNAAGGTNKESGVIGTLLEYVPNLIVHEVGAIVINETHLAHYKNLVNVLTGERITSLPFQMVVTPDARFRLLAPKPVLEKVAQVWTDW